MKYRFAVPMALLLVTGAAPQRKTDTDWPSFGRDPGAQRYSPLTQITPQNVSQLQPAWSFDTGVTNLQVTPIVIDGLMYLSGGTSVFALEPETGKEIWRYDPKSKVARRGVAYWPGDGTLRPRLFAGVADGRLVSLDARTGEPVAAFGDRGFVDLKAGVRGVDGPYMLESPAVVYKNVVITGGANTEGEPSLGLYGDIRGWDARTGRLLWSFHTVPRPGEPGVETWEGESWKNRSGTNAWTYMTLDVDRGLVFAGTGSATSDFYGADRKGRNLYANSLLALDANTGKLEWFQQLVHHDIWDWDLPAAPTLIEVTKNGRRIPAVAQMTKMSTLFIFDRRNGEPVFGMEERQVPQTDLPGEETSPTQPFPLRPAPLSRTTFDPATDLYTLTPEHAKYCRDLWDDNRMFTRGMFTPPTVDRTMVTFPSTLGGGNWSGLSYDPVRGLLFTNIMNLGQVARMEKRADGAGGPVPVGMEYKRTSPWGNAYARFWNPETKMPCSVAAVRGARRRGREQWIGRLARAARRLRRVEGARLRQDRNAEHRRHHRDVERRRVRGCDDRQALPRLQRADGRAAVGNDARRQRARHADDVHGPRPPSVRRGGCQRRRSPGIASRTQDRGVCVAREVRFRETRTAAALKSTLSGS